MIRADEQDWRSVADMPCWECAECGVRDEQVPLTWDPIEKAWLCPRCGDLLQTLREAEAVR